MIPPVSKQSFDGAVPDPKHRAAGSLFEALPHEILEKILSHLPILQIPAMACVNQSMRRGCQSVIVRKLLNKRQLPLRRFGVTSVCGVLNVFKALGEELKYLKVVDLRGIDVDTASLVRITELTPRLSRLYLACSSFSTGIETRNTDSLSPLGHHHFNIINGVLFVREEILPRLKKLCIRNNLFFSSTHLQTVGEHATKLKKLDLCGCNFVNNSSFGELSERITTLTTLKLSPNIFSSEPGLEKLVKANPNLSTLKFFRSPTLDLEPLQPFSKITKFSLYHGNRKSVAWYEKLADCLPNVRDLCFNYCEDLTSLAAVNFMKKCTRLQLLDVRLCNQLDDQVVLLSEGFLSRIKSLSLRNCNLSDRSLAWIGAKGTNIQTLKLCNNYAITDVGITALCQASRSLKKVNLRYCYSLTETAMDSLVCSQTGLTSINFSNNRLSYQRSTVLAQGNISLRKLTLLDCSDLTDITLATLLGAHRNLSSLKVNIKGNITSQGFLAALSHIKCLEILVIQTEISLYPPFLQEIKKIQPYCEVRRIQ